MNQIFIGSLIPFLCAACLYACRGCRASLRLLTVTPLVMALGAAWAVVPDIPRLLGRYDLYHRLARDPRTDIFFWHFTIDRVEDGTFWYMGGLALMGFCLAAAAWRELYLEER